MLLDWWILKLKFLNGKTYGKKMAYICKNNYIDIDYPQDLNYAKFVMKSKNSFKPEKINNIEKKFMKFEPSMRPNINALEKQKILRME